MQFRPSWSPRGLTILEALVLLIVCALLGLVAIPVTLVRLNIWKPDTDVGLRPAGKYEGEVKTPDVAPAPKLPTPTAPKLPPSGGASVLPGADAP